MSTSILLMAATILMAACVARAEPSSGPAEQQPAGLRSSQTRVLAIGTRYEVKGLLPKIRSVANSAVIANMFNAALTLNDGSGSVRPYLAEVPELNTDAWRVFPDGRMETTYKLRPGLTWHDGQSLEAEDFVFAQRVYTNSRLSIFPSSPQNLMETVVAADPRTLVIRWRAPYPGAGNIQMAEFDPIPRHIMEQAFTSVEQNPAGADDAFLGLPYSSSEYIGAGPYKLVHWEPGSSFEGVAFEGYVLGRPKIDRIIIQIIVDDTVILTGILAGTLDWAYLRFEQGLVLQRDWVPGGKGVMLFERGGVVSYAIQLRPDYVGHPALLDVRVRRALAHSIDRQAINDGVFDGQGFMTETMVPQTEPFYPEVDRAVVHHPYDPRRTDQLMNEAGFAKDHDGFFANAAGERYWLDFSGVAGSEFERTQLILTNGWQRAGFEVRPSILPVAQIGSEQRHTFPGMLTRGGGQLERYWTSAEIGTPENRWAGENRGGWSNPEYDRLYDALTTTLDRSERTRQFVQMLRLLSEQLPVFFTHFPITPIVHVAALSGPMVASTGTGAFTSGAYRNWNIHEWKWR